jgi:hypothetical protein
MKHIGKAMTNIGLFILLGYGLFWLMDSQGLVSDVEREQYLGAPLILLGVFLIGGIALRIIAARSGQKGAARRGADDASSARDIEAEWEEMDREAAAGAKSGDDWVLTLEASGDFSFHVAYWPHPRAKQRIFRTEPDQMIRAYDTDSRNVDALGGIPTAQSMLEEIETLAARAVAPVTEAEPVPEDPGPVIMDGPPFMPRSSLFIHTIDKEGNAVLIQTHRDDGGPVDALLSFLESLMAREEWARPRPG